MFERDANVSSGLPRNSTTIPAGSDCHASEQDSVKRALLESSSFLMEKPIGLVALISCVSYFLMNQLQFV